MRHKTVITITVLMAAATIALAAGDDFGGVKTLRPNSMLQDNVPPAVAVMTGDEPGMNAPLPRAYLGAPPQVPHTVADFVIDKEQNDCIGCHLPDYAGEGTTPIPATHMIKAELNNARFNCDQCHVPQSDAKALVANDNDSLAVGPK